MKLGVVLLAAGKSERFGGNKLLASFGGKPLILRALEATCVLSADKTCIVTGSAEIAALAQAQGFEAIMNPDAYLGQSHSIHLGIAEMQDMDAVLLMVCDQPQLTGASLARLAESFCASQKGIACLKDETHMGNPAIFSSGYFPELMALAGDRGAKGILKAHPDDLLVVSCVSAHELADADTPQALEDMQRIACN